MKNSFEKSYFKNCCKQKLPKFLRKSYHGPVITMMLVAWWRNQNKKNFFVVILIFLLLGKPLITEIFEVFMEGAICETMIMLTLMTSAIRIRKSIFVRVLISFLDLINSLWLKLALQAPTLQNGQTHSNNLLAVSHELFECVWSFFGIGA